jgi:intracellular sulfur oxidation DsrE/DsrF family protein
MNKFFILVVSFLLTLPVAFAEEGLEDKPFAETHVIMQVSDAEEVHHQATLDISNNLTKRYGQEMIDIEVIAFGVGVPMMFAEDNKFAPRIASLMEYGVRFYVCGNTLDTLERKLGKRPELLPGVQVVQTGVKFLIDEIQRGYIPVHP